MSELPEGWVKAKISDVTFKCNQSKPNDDEAIKYIDIGSINRQSKKIENPQYLVGKDAPSRARKIVNTNDVLVSLTRPNLNAVALVDKAFDEQYASTGFEVLKPIGVDSRYLFALVRTNLFVNTISGAVKGALYPAAKSSDVQDYEFPLAPLNEQKRIADKLDSILDKVDRAQARLEKIPGILKRFRQSVLAAATSGELTREWRTLNNQSEGKFVLLGDIGQVIAGQSPSVKEVNFEGKGEPYVTGPEQWDGKKILHHKWTEYPKKIAPENSIFVTVKGAGVGKTFPGCHAAIGRDVYAFVPKDGVEYLYVLYAIQASAEEVVSKAKGIIPGLTKSDLTEHEIYLPMIAEQIEIVRRVETLFTLTNVVEKQYVDAKSRAKKLAQSILAIAFRGELVEQNAADEPAIKLLERIKQQQLDTPKPTRQNRRTNKTVNPAVDSSEPSAELEPPKSDILSLLKNSKGELTAQQIIDQSSEKTFEQVDALFTELKRLLDSNLIIKVGAGEACAFKAIKR